MTSYLCSLGPSFLFLLSKNGQPLSPSPLVTVGSMKGCSGRRVPTLRRETFGDSKGLMSFSGLGTRSGYVTLGRLLWAYPTSLSQPLALSVSIPVTLISLLSPAHNTHFPDMPLAHASPLCQEANGISSLRPLLATPSKMAAFFPATPWFVFLPTSTVV